jgi:hypothetical protein
MSDTFALMRALEQQDQLKTTVIARRAGVHRSFVSNHFAAQIAHDKAEIQSRFIAGLTAETALSAASLRVEMEAAKHQAREAQSEIRALKTRLARSLGEEIAAKRPEHGNPLRNDRRPARPVEQLLVSQSDLHREFRDSEEELEAARRLNRMLIRERTRARPSAAMSAVATRDRRYLLSRGRTTPPTRRRCEPLSGMIT